MKRHSGPRIEIEGVRIVDTLKAGWLEWWERRPGSDWRVRHLLLAWKDDHGPA